MRFSMLQKLRFKFLMINISLILVLILTAFFAVFRSTAVSLEAESGEAMANYLKMKTEKNDSQKFDSRNPNSESSRDMFCVMLDSSGELLNVSGYKNTFTMEVKEYLQKLSDLAIKTGTETGVINEREYRYTVYKSTRNIFIVFLDMSYETEILASMLKAFMIVGTLALMFVIFAGWLLTNIAIAPIEKAWTRQRQFIADASHELKTPLTVIMANTDIVLSSPGSVSPESRKWIEHTKSETERMKVLINNMLFLAKSDDARQLQSIKALTKLNLSDCVMECVLNFEPVCYEKYKELINNIENNIYIRGSESEIKQFIMIFLDNAMKYSGCPGSIYVGLEKVGEKAVLKFKNTGTPIPEKELPLLFERFYRASESREREDGGYGLGLSIAQAISEKHGAKISVTSDTSGTEFVIKFNQYKE